MAKKLMVILFTHAIFSGKLINIHAVNLINKSVGHLRLMTFNPLFDAFPAKSGLSVLTLFLIPSFFLKRLKYQSKSLNQFDFLSLILWNCFNF
ncbi:hypothetical protein CFNIH1_21390 [Citrobacter freundii CFNIH1]|nr:hypothetical protein CFNIH1_21390 [Citrobacter freundii CFNIH1]